MGRPKIHGFSHMPEYNIWRGMLARCQNPKNISWPRYGGRGIQIKFDSFEEFFAEVGIRPLPDLTIEKIDNELGYQRGNIRWATKSEQAQNRRLRKRCKRSHLFTPENTGFRKGGGRRCRECDRQDNRKCRAQRGASQRPPRNSSNCLQGHPLTPDNVYFNKLGSRYCKECARKGQSLNTAVRRYIKRFGGVVFLHDLPPLLPHDSLPVRWPATAETALLLAKKASEIQGSRPN